MQGNSHPKLVTSLQVYARPGEDFMDHANVHKLLGHMVESGVAAGYEEEEEEGDRGAGRRWGRPPKGSSIYGVHIVNRRGIDGGGSMNCGSHIWNATATDSQQAGAVCRLGLLGLENRLRHYD